jgi:hypothetical protein|tara:strand:- start:571 stop:867 length:297 start_codon:yes stop_codon:yes gene_type:complete
MYRHLKIGVKAMQRLPAFTPDAPPSLAKARASPSSGVAAATMKRFSHNEPRYRESTPGHLFHMDTLYRSGVIYKYENTEGAGYLALDLNAPPPLPTTT